jgi:4-hydroxybenzoate polyprenyltransferase
MPSHPSPIRTWLQLLRAPNLLTVPGDPVAGYLLACFGVVEDKLWPAIGASVCFYAGGLLLNDLADFAEDRRERPERPLPSGAAPFAAVGAVMVILFALALYLCWTIERTTFATGGALLLAIVVYNCGSKRLPALGAINMGLCRGLSMLLGATAVSHGDLTYQLIAYGRLDHLVIAVGTLVGYIAAVTQLARFETHTEIPFSAKWLPLLALVMGAGWFAYRLSPTSQGASIPLFLIAVVSAAQIGLLLTRDPAAPVPPVIGKLIRLLLLIQAAFCAAVGGVEGSLAAGLLVLFWPLSRLLGRWFYAS